MKQIFLIILTTMTVHFGYSQCGTCTIGFSGCPAGGGLCNKPDTATVGQAYNSKVRFYLPKILNDPTLLAQCSGCTSIKLRKVKIASITGLPPGITDYNFDKSQLPAWKGYYDISTNNDTLGCVSICGTPIASGIYKIAVNVLADVTAIGTPIGNVDQDNNNIVFYDTIIVNPSAVPFIDF
jgi:hypothetical protein